MTFELATLSSGFELFFRFAAGFEVNCAVGIKRGALPVFGIAPGNGLSTSVAGRLFHGISPGRHRRHTSIIPFLEEKDCD
jgi:hypothetical protein